MYICIYNYKCAYAAQFISTVQWPPPAASEPRQGTRRGSRNDMLSCRNRNSSIIKRVAHNKDPCFLMLALCCRTRERSETNEQLAPSCSTAGNWLFARIQQISSPLKYATEKPYASKFHADKHRTNSKKLMCDHVTPRCSRAKWI